MRKYNVYEHGTHQVLGQFLNVGRSTGTVEIFYLTSGNDIKSTFREDAYVKEVRSEIPFID